MGYDRDKPLNANAAKENEAAEAAEAADAAHRNGKAVEVATPAPTTDSADK